MNISTCVPVVECSECLVSVEMYTWQYSDVSAVISFKTVVRPQHSVKLLH